MPVFRFLIYAADNLSNQNNNGGIPAEDSTFRSDLEIGDQVTWLGNGTQKLISVEDENGLFNEVITDQTLQEPVTFNGISYSAGQIVTPNYIINFSGSDGQTYSMVGFRFGASVNSGPTDAIVWRDNEPPNNTVLTVTSEENPVNDQIAPETSSFVVCFTAGTLIRTPKGEIPIEDLDVGQAVATRRGPHMPIRWIGKRRIEQAELAQNPKLRPIRIKAGALGAGLPKTDLSVSRQHRILIQSKIAERMFGSAEVFVPAIRLAGLPGITIDTDATEVTYLHILLDQHEAIFADGAPAESLYTGKHAIAALGPAALEELEAIFPDLLARLSEQKTAYPIPCPSRQKQLVARHMKNGKPLCTGASETFFQTSRLRSGGPTERKTSHAALMH